MKRLILTAAIILAATFSSAAFTPLWLRDVQISPDGEKIAFCYKGDIYVVPAKGGSATRLTTLPSFEQTPFWSPDGKTIAFSSDRYGNFDIFTMPACGGSATRLTFNSTSETPLGFTPDGKNILFAASIQAPATSAQFPRASFSQVYSVPAKGGKSVQVLGTPAIALSWSPKGDFFVYQDTKGMEDTWRKHHISSVTRDIWKYDLKSGRHTNLTDRAGEDLNPVLSADGRTVYILSEPAEGDGHPKPEGWQTSINVFSFELSKPGVLKQVTRFDTHPVRFLSRGGDTLCYTWNGEIYTQPTGGTPTKVEIDLTLDEENSPEVQTLTNGASESAVSPDGKQLAFVVHGEVYVTSVEYKTTKKITDTPEAESGLTFGSDSRSLAYASDRDGVSQLYIARMAREEDPDFANAALVTEEPLLQAPGTDRRAPRFSPDGKKIAFIEDRTRLMVADLETKKVTQVTDGSCWYDRGDTFNYSWSPDSKWLTLEYVPNGRDPYTNIGLVSAEGGSVTDLTGSGYINVNPTFTHDGNAILFESNRYGMRSHASWGSEQDVFLCFLNRKAYDRARLSKEDVDNLKEKKDSSKTITVDFKGIEDRIVRITPNSSNLGHAILSQDGETMYYTARFEDKYDLWKTSLRKRETKLLLKDSGPGKFASDESGKEIFLLGGSPKKLDGEKLKSISYSAELTTDHAAEREYMFNYVEREEAERFYCVDMHGVDWKKYCDAYRRFLPHINNNYDFAELLSELLGELNVSHTGGRYSSPLKSEPTGHLGLLYDLTYKGEGLKVAEVISEGPCDRENLDIRAGDILTGIGGCKISGSEDPGILLRGTVGKKTLVSIKGKKDIVVVPVNAAALSSLMYDRWVKRNAAEVERLSGGRLGYVHIKGMNDASFRTIYNDILGKYNKCDGIVIDQRFNGGGRLHEDIEILFNAEKYLTQVARGREACDMPSRRWNKPSIMLQCECDYSNAHGTPWVYSYKKIGKLVGTPVPGTMTSVNWVTMIDRSMVFGIPVIGYRTADGYYLEDSQLEPDILVRNSPEDLLKGKDAQLEAAVRELLKEIDAK